MKIIALDFYSAQEVVYNTIDEARRAIGDQAFEYYTRYAGDWHLKNSERFNEWLEVNCHNNEVMIIPEAGLYSDNDLYEMVEYWHESIAFGKFGDESVAFEFSTPEKQRGYDVFCTDKWLKENMQTLDELETWQWHDDCEHERDDEGGYTDAGERELEECEEYQIDQYIYESGHGYYGAPDIDRQTKRAYVLQTNEYAGV